MARWCSAVRPKGRPECARRNPGEAAYRRDPEVRFESFTGHLRSGGRGSESHRAPRGPVVQWQNTAPHVVVVQVEHRHKLPPQGGSTAED